MKFDLFDAMRHMEKQFGSDGELLIRQSGTAFRIRLSVLKNDCFHNCEFMVSLDEVIDAKVDLMNRKFRDAIEQLKRHLQLRDAAIAKATEAHNG